MQSEEKISITEVRKIMKNTKNFKKSTNVATEAKNVKYISDYEMNSIIANKICDIIESGNVAEWKKGWALTGKNLNRNSVNFTQMLKAYYELVMDDMLAINVYSLQSFDWSNGNVLPSGFYVSFTDIKAHKLKLKKGSKGEATYKPCKFDKFLTEKEKEIIAEKRAVEEEFNNALELLEEGKTKELVVKFSYLTDKGDEKEFNEKLMFNKVKNCFYYTRFQYVLEYQFNIECLETKLDVKKLWGLDKKKTTQKKKSSEADNVRNEEAEAIREDYCRRANLKFEEVNQDRAFYSPASHSVTLPLFAQFFSSEEYYQTMFHELAHSTGAESLLNRKGITTLHHWGDNTYAREELVAELSSIYTTKALGIATEKTFQNSIAYLKSWGNSLRENIRHNIVATINASQKATELILNLN